LNSLQEAVIAKKDDNIHYLNSQAYSFLNQENEEEQKNLLERLKLSVDEAKSQVKHQLKDIEVQT